MRGRHYNAPFVRGGKALSAEHPRRRVRDGELGQEEHNFTEKITCR
jgi:hypothetical protein